MVVGIFVVCEAVVVVLIVVVVLGTAVVILVVVLPFSVVLRCVVVVVLPVTVLTVEVLSVVVVTAVVRRTAVTSMNENVVGRGGSTAPLLFFLCVVVTAGAFSPDTVVTVVPFCTAVSPLLAVTTAVVAVTGMPVFPFSSVVGGAVVFASVTLN